MNTKKAIILDALRASYEAHGRGFYLGDKEGFRQCADLDGTHAREYLEGLGFEVVASGDKGNRGFAHTSCGLDLSTNGHISRI